jgi:hypothetical protein
VALGGNLYIIIVAKPLKNWLPTVVRRFKVLLNSEKPRGFGLGTNRKRSPSMLKEKPGLSTEEEKSLTAYITDSQDREGNVLYIAAICDNKKNELIEELSGYTRDELEKEVLQHYPGIEIENG